MNAYYVEDLKNGGSKKVQIKASPNKLFLALCAVFFGYFLFQILYWNPWGSMFLFFPDKNDSFMDFYNVLMSVASQRPYDCGGLFPYPPLVGLLLIPFTLMIPSGILSDMLNTSSQYSMIPLKFIQIQAIVTRESISGIIALIFFLGMAIICLLLFAFLGRNEGIREKLLYVAIILTSSPFMYAVQRGNTIIYAVMLLMFFVIYKDSNKKWLREAALLALALAAGIKVFPALFGILLIRDRRWIDALKAVLYGISVSLLPFSFFGGFSAMRKLFETLADSTQYTYSQGLFYKVNLTNTLRTMGMYLGWLDDQMIEVGSVFSFVLLALAILAAVFINKPWKAILLVTFAVILTPAFNFYYALIYLVIPILFFLNDKNKGRLDYLYAIIFAMLISPVYLGATFTIHDNYVGRWPLTYQNVLQSSCCALFYIALVIEGCVCFMRRIIIDKFILRTDIKNPAAI